MVLPRSREGERRETHSLIALDLLKRLTRMKFAN